MKKSLLVCLSILVCGVGLAASPHPYRRSICVDELHYNPDGTIQEVKPTKEGVAGL